MLRSETQEGWEKTAAIPSALPPDTLVDFDKLNLEFTRNNKGPIITKILLEEKNKVDAPP